MSTGEPEMSSRSEGNAIPQPKFSTVWRGYDPGQVSEYLSRVAGRVQVLESRAWELESELEQARMQGGTGAAPTGRADPIEAVSDRVAEVVRAFDQDVELMRSEAEAEARRIVDEAKADAEREARETDERRRETAAQIQGTLTEARAQADRIRVDAQAKAEAIRAKAERALEDARARADALLSDLESRRGALLADIRDLHDRMLESAGSLRPMLEGEPAADEVVVTEESVAVSEGAGESPKLVSPGG
jgi:DivIVA domain-containing protein